MIRFLATSKEISAFFAAGHEGEVLVGRAINQFGSAVLINNSRFFVSEPFGYDKNNNIVYKEGYEGAEYIEFCYYGMAKGMHRMEMEVLGYVVDDWRRVAGCVVDTKKVGKNKAVMARVKILFR